MGGGFQVRLGDFLRSRDLNWSSRLGLIIAIREMITRLSAKLIDLYRWENGGC